MVLELALSKTEQLGIDKLVKNQQYDVAVQSALDAIYCRYNSHFERNSLPEYSDLVLIGGYSRVGKSILARAFAEKTGCAYIQADVLREFFWTIDDDDLRFMVRLELYSGLLASRFKGLVIEGDDFISKNRHLRRAMKPFSLELMERLCKTRDDVHPFIIGNAYCGKGDKTSALELWRASGQCWTSNTLSSAQIEDLSSKTIESSLALRDLAETHDIQYIEVRPSCFDEDIARAVEKIFQAR
ncbi:MAG: hypothetical protein LAT65_21410 [Saccharospirillum sp.]|nr:hypothetical protein [Saccharospirillum sp.]